MKSPFNLESGPFWRAFQSANQAKYPTLPLNSMSWKCVCNLQLGVTTGQEVLGTLWINKTPKPLVLVKLLLELSTQSVLIKQVLPFLFRITLSLNLGKERDGGCSQSRLLQTHARLGWKYNRLPSDLSQWPGSRFLLILPAQLVISVLKKIGKWKIQEKGQYELKLLLQ